MCINTLLNDIESQRRKMVHLASATSLSNEEVIKKSIQLDQLLNKYYLVQSKK